MFILSKTPSVANHFINELRDIKIQKDRMRFRKNLERLGEILAYEVGHVGHGDIGQEQAEQDDGARRQP